MAGTVTIACKLPHGIALQLQEQVSRSEPVMGGGYRETGYWVKVGAPVVINGVAQKFGHAGAQLTAGFALTYGVDADFWAKWLEQNAELDAVKKGFIFAHEKAGVVDGMAKERRKERTGLEPLDPNNLPDEFKRRIETVTAD